MNNKYEVEKLNMVIQKYSNIPDYREFEKVISILFKLDIIDMNICMAISGRRWTYKKL